MSEISTEPKREVIHVPIKWAGILPVICDQFHSNPKLREEAYKMAEAADMAKPLLDALSECVTDGGALAFRVSRPALARKRLRAINRLVQETLDGLAAQQNQQGEKEDEK